MSLCGEPRTPSASRRGQWEKLQQGGSAGHDACRSSFLEPPTRSFFRARTQQTGKRPMEAAGAVDAENAPTAPWKTTERFSTSYHRPSSRELSVTHVPG